MLYFKITNKKLFFQILLLSIQISFIFSATIKCYSIKNCEKCPDLDFCEKCKPGFFFNKPKTKCLDNNKNNSSNKSKNSNTSTKNSNQANVNIQQNNPKPPVDPFQGIPFASIQRMKQNDLNRIKINRLLVFILIVLVLSIIVSTIYDLIKKFKYQDDEYQEETRAVDIQ